MATKKVKKVEKVKEVKKVPARNASSKADAGGEKTNKYAVIRFGTRQYLVEEGKEILVDKLVDSKKLDFDVLLVVDGDKIKIGKPVIKDASVKIKVISELEKGEKVRVFKYKAKSRYRKRIGFRPQYTRLLIEKIS